MPSPRSWNLRINGREYRLMPGSEVGPGTARIAPGEAWFWLERFLHRHFDGRAFHGLQSAAADLGIRIGRSGGTAALKRAIESGQIVLTRAGGLGGANAFAQGPKGERVQDQVRSARERKTWVEFEVLDAEGLPARGSRYTCMLPDGRVHEGVLDENGVARFDEIDPGNCVFVLADLHKDEWVGA